MRVAMLAPINQNDSPFYSTYIDFMQTAARQLEIELEVVDCTNDGTVFLRRGLDCAARATPPDYVLCPNFMGTASELVPAFAKVGTPVLLVVEGFGGGDRLVIGHQNFSMCLGEVVPDDIEAGRELGQALLEEARRRGMAKADGKLHVGTLAGMQTQVGRLRFQGWKACLETSPDVVHAGFRYGSQSGGEVGATALLESDRDIRVLWCFNDALALEAMNGIAKLGMEPGQDVLVGGIDLLEPALEAISAGAMHVSLGGHLVDGVRALLLLDEHRWTPSTQPQVHTTRLEVVKADESEGFRRFMKAQAWHDVDFTRFSARRNPSGSREQLSLRSLVKGWRRAASGKADPDAAGE